MAGRARNSCARRSVVRTRSRGAPLDLHMSPLPRENPLGKGRFPRPWPRTWSAGLSLAWAGSAPQGQALPSSLVPREVRAAYLALT